MKEKLALINASLDEDCFRAGKGTLALSYLSEALAAKYDIIVLPVRPYNKNDFRTLLKEILEKVKGVNVVGISANTFSRFYADTISLNINKRYPTVTILLGGRGIPKPKGELDIPKKIAAPQLIFIDVNEAFTDVELLLSNLCPQNCGYCSSPKNQIPVSVEDYLLRIDEGLKKGRKIRRITLYDNNPLHPLNFERTKEFFSGLRAALGYIPDSVLYCDPALLVDKTEFNRIADFLILFKSRNNNLFFGREHCDHRIINKIKRRSCNKIRTQGQLDKEKDAMLMLASMLNTTPEGMGLNFTLVLNYILSPFEDEKSINRLLDEARLFMKSRRVILKSNFLWLFPGTELWKEYSRHYMPPEEMRQELKFFNYESMNYWKEDYENSLFLDLCNALCCRLYFYLPDAYNSWYNISMLRVAMILSLKEYNKNLISSIAKEIPLPNLKDKFMKFGKIIYEKNYSNITKENKIRLMRDANRLFFNLHDNVIKAMCGEFRKTLEMRENHFS